MVPGTARVHRVEDRMRRLSASDRLPNGTQAGKAARQAAARALRVPIARRAWPSKRTLPVSLCKVPQMQLTRVGLLRPLGPIRPETFAVLHLGLDRLEGDEPTEALARLVDVEQRAGILLWNRPTMPCGATMTNTTISTPATSTLMAEEMVTRRYSCGPPTSTAPIMA